VEEAANITQEPFGVFAHADPGLLWPGPESDTRAQHIDYSGETTDRYDLDGIEAAGFICAADGVPGDFYDFLVTGRGDLITFIGDAAGKGDLASPLMCSTKAALKKLFQGDVGLTPALESLNRLVLNDPETWGFVTLFLGRYNPEDRSLCYINCGHQPALWLTTSGVRRLGEGGTVLGALPEATYPASRVSLAPKDLLLLYTDGLTEARNHSGELFGHARLMELAGSLYGRPILEALEIIKSALFFFVEPGLPADDIAIMVLCAT
jgi:sigma-B regulation protein RsbU (phosphoserine phosphatase)